MQNVAQDIAYIQMHCIKISKSRQNPSKELLKEILRKDTKQPHKIM